MGGAKPWDMAAAVVALFGTRSVHDPARFWRCQRNQGPSFWLWFWLGAGSETSMSRLAPIRGTFTPLEVFTQLMLATCGAPRVNKKGDTYSADPIKVPGFNDVLRDYDLPRSRLVTLFSVGSITLGHPFASPDFATLEKCRSTA